MTQRIIPVEPFELAIFGATGDLSLRKLLPALFRRDLDGQLPDQASILGLARRDLDAGEFRAMAKDWIAPFAAEDAEGARAMTRFLERIDYQQLEIDSAKHWDALAKRLSKTASERIQAFYLSVAPRHFPIVARELHARGLSAAARLVVEKPFGRDEDSATELNAILAEAFDETQIYRIDHYLGKETVQNLMALRFANALFEPLWNARHIEHVQITAAETVGVEGRGDYYDNAGAMRDMVQNHLMQLLCLTAMEPPHRFDADAMRDEKLKVLRSLKPLSGEAALSATARGQYRAAKDEPGYLEECGDPRSLTETFVALRVDIENWRWAGAPFYLRTGKRLRSRLTEIHIAFRRPPHSIFADLEARPRPNGLVMRLQPDEGLELAIMTKDPGPGGFRLRETPLDMSFAETQGVAWRMPDAYERLLLDVVRGNQTLFMRRDEVEAAWAWIDPIIDSWAREGAQPEGYDSGGSGPAGAVELLARDGFRWREIAA